MTANRFSLERPALQGEKVSLSGREHHHLSRVARVRRGEEVWLSAPDGVSHRARVEEIDRSRTFLTILDSCAEPPPQVRLMLVQAVLKSRNMDWVLQKAAELGAGCVCPVYTRRTVVRLNGKNGNRAQRWVSILREAAKQSGRALIPDLKEPVPLEVFLDRKQDERRIFLSERGGVPLREMIARDLEAGLPASAVLAVGPEGGWSGEEERLLARYGYEAATLGRYILRAETAAVCGLAVLTHYWNG